MEASVTARDRLGPDEIAFLAERDSFYMATAGATGWPYIQHRGGPEGFLKVIDDRTLAFADFQGNKQFISTGNLTTDSRMAMILVDYPRQARLKILGRAEIFEGETAAAWIEKVQMPGYRAKVERVMAIRLEAFDWNCPQHITSRFTERQIQEALQPFEQKLRDLEEENKRLRDALTSQSQ
jgi:predicted pyridoxine 5'-phosphate oxidase superfamily flavin-nucleotide-binding protein